MSRLLWLLFLMICTCVRRRHAQWFGLKFYGHDTNSSRTMRFVLFRDVFDAKAYFFQCERAESCRDAPELSKLLGVIPLACIPVHARGILAIGHTNKYFGLRSLFCSKFRLY